MFLYCLDISCLLSCNMLSKKSKSFEHNKHNLFIEIEVFYIWDIMISSSTPQKRPMWETQQEKHANETKARPFHASAGRKLCLPRCHNFIWQQNAAPSPRGYDPMALIEDPQLPSCSEGARKVEGKPFTVDTPWPGTCHINISISWIYSRNLSRLSNEKQITKLQDAERRQWDHSSWECGFFAPQMSSKSVHVAPTSPNIDRFVAQHCCMIA